MSVIFFILEGIMKLRIVLQLFVLLLTAAQAFAGFDEGLAAAKAGNFKTALAEWRPLADQGNASAQYNLGVMYSNGEGVSQDFAEAAKWYRKAADQGNGSAQFKLGFMYDVGQGISKDFAEAAKWYRKAADQGIASAQSNLGFMYHIGKGVSKNFAEAAKWYQKAAGQGNASAQYNLGVMYANGQGISKDSAEAVRWYRKAADQGDASAYNGLGFMYFNGLGCDKDTFTGMKWYAIAAYNGIELAKNIFEKHENEFTPEVIANLKDAAKVYRPKALKMSPDDEASWLNTYRKTFAEAKTYGQMKRFITLYVDDDPENLLPKVNDKLITLAVEESKRAEAEEKKQKATLKKRQQQFITKLKTGSDSHCGMVIEIKKPLAKIQTMVGEKWFRIEQLYPKGDADCRFVNGEYVEKKEQQAALK